MFNEAAIAQCILPLVQFVQPSDPGYTALDSRLTTSQTGRTVLGTHPLCTIENLKNSAPEFGAYVYPDWTTGTAIKAGVVQNYNGQLYVSISALSAASNIVAPDVSPDFETTDPFSQWLVDLKTQAAIEVVSTVFRNRKILNYSKTLLENTRLYEGGGMLNDRVINTGDFVGMAIELKPNQNIVNYITQIGIQLDGAINNLNIYIFHSSLSDPVYTIPINAKGGLSFNWNNVLDGNGQPVAIKHFDNDVNTGHDMGGVYFIGYYQNDLDVVQAIEKRFNVSVAPCISCDQFNVLAYRKWNKFIKATAFRVQAENLTTGAPKLWDIELTEWVYNTNWGFNLAFAVQCDVSQFICSNANVFADSFAKQIALKCLEVMVNATRMNGVAQTTKQLAASELDPKAGSGSLRSFLNDSIAAVDWDISGFDQNCLPCTTRGKLTWEAI